jgi:hypothetical protein
MLILRSFYLYFFDEKNFIFILKKYCMKLQELIQNPLYKKKFVLEKLLSHYLNKTREELWMDAEQDIPEDILKRVQQDYNDYDKEDKPLEYLL